MPLIQYPVATLLDATAGFALFFLVSALLRRDMANENAYGAFVLLYATPIAFFFIAAMTFNYEGKNYKKIRNLFFLAGIFGYVLTVVSAFVLWVLIENWKVSLLSTAVVAVIISFWFYITFLLNY